MSMQLARRLIHLRTGTDSHLCPSAYSDNFRAVELVKWKKLQAFRGGRETVLVMGCRQSVRSNKAQGCSSFSVWLTGFQGCPGTLCLESSGYRLTVIWWNPDWSLYLGSGSTRMLQWNEDQRKQRWNPSFCDINFS